MQAAPARYVSVSELYSTDEVELLLDEIRELEPTSCRGEDVQDFEIAGSGCGGGAGGRSPAGTEATERSWDSHAQYLRAPLPRAEPLAPLYCHRGYLLSGEGVCAALLVLVTGAACCALWAGGGPRLPPPARPAALAALSSLLLHAALYGMRLTQLYRLMPLDWHTLGMCASVWSLTSLCGGGSVLLQAALSAPHYLRQPRMRHAHLAAVGLSYAGALVSVCLVALAARVRCGGGAARARRRSGAARGAYRAVPTASPAPHPPL